ncbi:ABC transporter permease [Robiginitomaculum antarcticum]|uniref:ABC transporter permease n=1 Tax=Robiginitomaculum antarcticum TaxID=437507 RepID=UPI0003658F2C|nr:ABC transporter permease [Robiginitomaculum antarcticum]
MMNMSLFDDLASSLKNWRFWARFAWQDVVNANIRTHAGIVLYPVLAAIWIVTISILFGDILGADRDDFMAYVGVGYVVFTFISGCITASYSVFSRNLKIIQNVPIGIMNFPLRETSRFLFQMLLQCITVAIIFVATDINLTLQAFWIIPAVIFLIIFGLCLTLLFAIIGTYLPDLAALTSSFMRLLFFITPIWWYPGLRGGTRALIADMNPITHFIRLFRYPLLEGGPPPPLTLIMTAGSMCLALVVTLCLFAATRRHILLRL